MDELTPRFDMTRDPIPTRWFLRPLTYLLSLPDTLLHRTRIHKEGVEGLKPPYVLLCNHNASMDFKVATIAMFPHRANYVVAIDGFIRREALLRSPRRRRLTFRSLLRSPRCRRKKRRS